MSRLLVFIIFCIVIAYTVFFAAGNWANKQLAVEQRYNVECVLFNQDRYTPGCPVQYNWTCMQLEDYSRLTHNGPFEKTACDSAPITQIHFLYTPSQPWLHQYATRGRIGSVNAALGEVLLQQQYTCDQFCKLNTK